MFTRYSSLEQVELLIQSIEGNASTLNQEEGDEDEDDGGDDDMRSDMNKKRNENGNESYLPLYIVLCLCSIPASNKESSICMLYEQ